MGRRRTGTLLGAGYVLVAAALLGAALFAPWYYYDGQWGKWSGPSISVLGPRNTTFYLLSLPGSGPVQASCLGASIPSFCPLSASYSGAGFNSTAGVVLLTLTLAAAAFAASTLAGILGVILRRRPRSTSLVMTLAIAAVILAIAATASFAALLPTSFGNDTPESQRYSGPTGPWTSFFGSVRAALSVPCFARGCPPPTTESWGPGLGWALEVAGVAVLLVGTAMMIRFQRPVADLSPSSATAASVSVTKRPKSTT